jgi:NADP-dependent 3-hydroxy acid dehydrogenase YdfG
MSSTIAGKVVVITGASSGLGEATARLLSAEGAGSVNDPDAGARIRAFYAEVAVPAVSFARAVAFAIGQPDDVDINEILFRPTQQEL